MTTIAYRWGVLASDSRTMLGGWKAPYSVEKLFRLPDGTVAGVCGNLADASAFVQWLRDGEKGDRPTLNETTIIRLLKDGSLIIHEDGGFFPVKTDFGAWGSGGPIANAAMHMGADAQKAVEVASLFDDNTGGAVIAMKCEV